MPHTMLGAVYSALYIFPWVYLLSTLTGKRVSREFIFATYTYAYLTSIGLVVYFNLLLDKYNNSNTIPISMIVMILVSMCVLVIYYWNQKHKRNENLWQLLPHYLYVIPFVPMYIGLILVVSTLYTSW